VQASAVSHATSRWNPPASGRIASAPAKSCQRTRLSSPAAASTQGRPWSFPRSAPVRRLEQRRLLRTLADRNLPGVDSNGCRRPGRSCVKGCETEPRRDAGEWCRGLGALALPVAGGATVTEGNRTRTAGRHWNGLLRETLYLWVALLRDDLEVASLGAGVGGATREYRTATETASSRECTPSLMSSDWM